jgi:hypothetical protein
LAIPLNPAQQGGKAIRAEQGGEFVVRAEIRVEIIDEPGVRQAVQFRHVSAK